MLFSMRSSYKGLWLAVILLVGLSFSLSRSRHCYIEVTSEPAMEFRGVLNSRQVVTGTTPTRFEVPPGEVECSFQGLGRGLLKVEVSQDGAVLARGKLEGRRPVVSLGCQSESWWPEL